MQKMISCFIPYEDGRIEAQIDRETCVKVKRDRRVRDRGEKDRATEGKRVRGRKDRATERRRARGGKDRATEGRRDRSRSKKLG